MSDFDTPEELAAATNLSRRQAEAYLLVSDEHRGMRVKDAAEKMGIESKTLSGWLTRIRDKIEEAPEKARKAEATADLSI